MIDVLPCDCENIKKFQIKPLPLFLHFYMNALLNAYGWFWSLYFFKLFSMKCFLVQYETFSAKNVFCFC